MKENKKLLVWIGLSLLAGIALMPLTANALTRISKDTISGSIKSGSIKVESVANSKKTQILEKSDLIKSGTLQKVDQVDSNKLNTSIDTRIERIEKNPSISENNKFIDDKLIDGNKSVDTNKNIDWKNNWDYSGSAVNCDDQLIALACLDPGMSWYDQCPEECRQDGRLLNNLTKTVEFKSNQSSRKIVFDGTYTALKDNVSVNHYSVDTEYDESKGNDYIEQRCKKNDTEMTFYLYVDGEEVTSTHTFKTCTLWQWAGFGSWFDKISFKKWQPKNIRVEVEIDWYVLEDDMYDFTLTLNNVARNSHDSDSTWKVNARFAPIKIKANNAFPGVITDTSKNRVLLRSKNTELAKFSIKPSNTGTVTIDTMVFIGKFAEKALKSEDIRLVIDGTEYDGYNTGKYIVYFIDEEIPASGAVAKIILKENKVGNAMLTLMSINDEENIRKEFRNFYGDALVHIDSQQNNSDFTKYSLWVDLYDDSYRVWNVKFYTNTRCSWTGLVTAWLWEFVNNGDNFTIDNMSTVQTISCVKYDIYSGTKLIWIHYFNNIDYPDYFKVDGVVWRVYRSDSSDSGSGAFAGYPTITKISKDSVLLRARHTELATFKIKPSNNKEGLTINTIRFTGKIRPTRYLNEEDIRLKLDGNVYDGFYTGWNIVYFINHELPANGVVAEVTFEPDLVGEVELILMSINNSSNFYQKTFTKSYADALVYISSQRNEGDYTKYRLAVDKYDDSYDVTGLVLWAWQLVGWNCVKSWNLDGLNDYISNGDEFTIDNGRENQTIKCISYYVDGVKYSFDSLRYPDYFKVDGAAWRVYRSDSTYSGTGYSWTGYYGNSYPTEMLDAYSFAYENWITTASNIDEARIYSPLTRWAMAKMLVKYAMNTLWMQPDTSRWVPSFGDYTNELDKQYDYAITLSYQLWIMWQNAQYFRATDSVTRAEFATALSRMLYKTPDGNPYYISHLNKLREEWIIDKIGDPYSLMLRWYAMLMLMRSVNN